jgi:hypothetical protein
VDASQLVARRGEEVLLRLAHDAPEQALGLTGIDKSKVSRICRGVSASTY